MTHPGQRNRLAQEKSPYLLQHADNPVDWYPWCPEAFEKARREEKPIFLSIGYSSCHWCHVMEAECFADHSVAELLNRAFVSIKVDREERPDIDAVYMQACLHLTGSGGWPLTIIATPEGKPFFAATYIPRETTQGRTGLLDLLPQIEWRWQARRDKVEADAQFVAQTLGASRDAAGTAGEELLRLAVEGFAAQFDARHGGFGEAPKFPTPHAILFLLRWWERSDDARARAMVEQTLDAMARGGIFDQLGFGLHRYATDARWLLPHFEKMLVDQAMALLAYAEAWRATGEEAFRRTADRIAEYVLRDLQRDGGGFFTAEDADSAEGEGRFFLWRREEIERALGGEEADAAIAAWRIEEEGNYVDPATGHTTGLNILHLRRPLGELAEELGTTEEALAETLERARGRLLYVREGRPRPRRDEKILADANGLMIAALARAGRLFEEPILVDAARAAAAFIRRELTDDKGRLLHRWCDGEVRVPALLDDCAALGWGLVELFAATGEEGYRDDAVAIAEEMLARFGDEEEGEGGLFTTPIDSDIPLPRQKEAFDGAVPSGNSLAAFFLARLAQEGGVGRFAERARAIVAAFAGLATRGPTSFAFLLTALDELLERA